MSNEHTDQAPVKEKSYDIIVNGRPRVVTERRLGYADAVRLAFPDGNQDGNVLYTISYANPHGRDGTLAEGQDVEVKEGMSFNVGKTNRS